MMPSTPEIQTVVEARVVAGYRLWTLGTTHHEDRREMTMHDMHEATEILTVWAVLALARLVRDRDRRVLVNHTADNITDEQIRQLARGALTAAQHKDCTIALGARREMLTLIAGKIARTCPTTRQRRAARARCAEILNARIRT